jgi:transposase-like protein
MPKPVSSESPTEVVANPEHDRRLRRRFSAEDKRRILTEADACSERGQLSALLRRERLYSSQLAGWRAQVEHEGQAGLEAKKPGRRPLKDPKDRRIDELERDKSRLERKLLITQKLIELQKNAHELLAAAQPADKP